MCAGGRKLLGSGDDIFGSTFGSDSIGNSFGTDNTFGNTDMNSERAAAAAAAGRSTGAAAAAAAAAAAGVLMNLPSGLQILPPH